MASVYQIPIQQEPNQELTVDLADGSTYDIELRTMLGNLYFSAKKDGAYIYQNIICQNKNPIGRFIFVDLDGNSDPKYDQLNDRFALGFIY